MNVISIDETIKKFLKRYAARAERVIDANEKRIPNIKNDQERADNINFLNRSKESYKFLQNVVQNPKEYLYRKTDIIYSQFEDGTSVYDKLFFVMGGEFDHRNLLLVRLSECIAAHMNSSYINTNTEWVYVGRESYDYEAEQILEINKKFVLIDSNDLVSVFKSFAPQRWFAVKKVNEK